MPMEDEENEILNEQFAIYPGKIKYNVTLTNVRIRIEQIGQANRSKGEDIVMLNDVTGSHVLQGKAETSSSAYLCVYSYPLRKKKLGSGIVRQRVTKTFTIDCNNTYQENFLIAERWKMTIKRLITGEKIKTKEDIENGCLAARNLLVLVNPFSGRKKASAIYKEKVKPMFLEAEIKHSVQHTDYAGHAREMAKKIVLEDWDGIVIISGDGLVHEVINGLMDRPDWKKAIQMPIGIIPGGSGNALAAAVVYASTGQILSNNLELDSIFEVIRGSKRKMSLAAIETEAGQKYYSFLNFAWGFIADVDLESERFRKLGPVRFAIGCAIRVASMRMYHGRLSYLPAVRSAYSFGRSQSYVDGSLSKNGSAYLANGKSSSISFDRRSLFGRSISKRSSNQDAIHSEVNLVNASTKEEESGDAFENSDDPANQQTSNEHSPAHDQEDQTTAPEENSQSGDHELGQHERGTAAGPTESNDTGPDADSGDVNSRTNDGGGGNQLAMATRPIEAPEHALPIAWKDSAIAYHLQAPFGHPTPDDWSVIESEYVWVTSVYLSHLGNEMMGVPEARLDDDVIYIYTLRKGIGKAQMISVLLGYEDGTHIEKGGEFSCVIPCRAVRLEPLNFITGHMTVDGEPVPHCSIQASVTPHKVNLMSSVSD